MTKEEEEDMKDRRTLTVEVYLFHPAGLNKCSDLYVSTLFTFLPHSESLLLTCTGFMNQGEALCFRAVSRLV